MLRESTLAKPLSSLNQPCESDLVLRNKNTGVFEVYDIANNQRCKLHGGKSTGPRTPEGLERSRRANWKHGHFSREAKAERSRLRAAILALRGLCDSIGPAAGCPPCSRGGGFR
jgi:hypothetical protein